MMIIPPHAFGVDDIACGTSATHTPSAWMTNTVVFSKWVNSAKHYWETLRERLRIGRWHRSAPYADLTPYFAI